MDKDFYLLHQEWDSISFPLIIYKLTLSRYGFDENTTIKISREDGLRLEGKIFGKTQNPLLTRSELIGRGNIIREEDITGFDVFGNRIKLQGCVLGNYEIKNFGEIAGEIEVVVNLLFDTVQISFSSQFSQENQDRVIEYNWFLCDYIPPLFFQEMTKRTKTQRVRIGIDEETCHDEPQTESNSNDFISFDYLTTKCIVSKVPDVLMTTNLHGIAIEFRGKTDATMLNNTRHFIEFLLGSRLLSIGQSRLIDDSIFEATAYNKKLNNHSFAKRPPIKYNYQYEWGNPSYLAKHLFPLYLKKNEQLYLNQILDRYWIAAKLPIGVNLPILASALEIVANAFLEQEGVKKFEYMSQNDYDRLLKDEITSIEEKLTKIDGGKIMLNKIKSAFRKSSNEKITLFFDLIDLKKGKQESNALKLRNSMTHSSRDYRTDKKVYDDLILTRIYECLFNRILLKILNYQGYYIDYSITGWPSKQINVSSGLE